MSGAIRNAKHPVASFFHLFFKVFQISYMKHMHICTHMSVVYVYMQTVALLVYLFGRLFTDSYVFLFVICILLLAFDFWTVKVCKFGLISCFMRIEDQ